MRCKSAFHPFEIIRQMVRRDLLGHWYCSDTNSYRKINLRSARGDDFGRVSGFKLFA